MRNWLTLQVFKLFIFLSSYNSAEEYWDDIASKYGVITGRDAERFLHNTRNPKFVSSERVDELIQNYDKIMAKAKL